MAQDLGIDWAAGPTISDPLDADISAGNSDTTASGVDLSTPSPIQLGVELIIVCASGTVDGTFDFYIYWSHDNTDFTDQPDEADLITSITPIASTTIKKVFSIPVQARYLKLHVDNNQTSGPTLTASGSSITIWDAYGDQA